MTKNAPPIQTPDNRHGYEMTKTKLTYLSATLRNNF